MTIANDLRRMMARAAAGGGRVIAIYLGRHDHDALVALAQPYLTHRVGEGDRRLEFDGVQVYRVDADKHTGFACDARAIKGAEEDGGGRT